MHTRPGAPSAQLCAIAYMRLGTDKRNADRRYYYKRYSTTIATARTHAQHVSSARAASEAR